MEYKPTFSHKVFLQEYESPAWNLCSYCLFQKPVSFDELDSAMNKVIQKNDALRMKVTNGHNLVFEEYTPRYFERAFFPDNTSFLSWARTKANQSVYHHPGMWTAYLLNIGGRTGIFNIGHHLMCDAMNVVNLYQKIVAELNGLESGSGSYSYSSYLEADELYLQGPKHERDKEYWEKALPDVIPLAFSGRPIGDCENISITLPSLNEFCSHYNLAEASVLYAAAGLVLLRTQGLDSLSLGIPVLGRTTQCEMRSLGLFMRDIPLIIHGGNKRFLDFVQEVESSLFDLFRHQKYDLPQRTLFDVSVDYSVYPKDENYDAHVVYNDFVSTAMEFHFLQRERLELTIRAQKGLLKDLKYFGIAFETLLHSIINAPEQSILEIPITQVSAEGELTVVPGESLFALINKQHSGKIIDRDIVYTLDDLLCDAEKIDFAIRRSKRTIAVLSDRSYTELAAIFGIIRGGNAYLPISPEYPPERIQLMLEVSGCDTVLAQKKYHNLVPDSLIIEDILKMPTPEPVLPIAATPEDTLYVIFTSGSTGSPKGAMVSNRSAVNRIQWMISRYFTADTIVMLKTPYTFDVSVWEIFGFALGGFTLYILPPEDHYRQDRVLEHIRKGKVTDLHFVPTVYRYFLDALEKDGGDLPSLRNIFLSGEALSASLVNDSPAHVHNLYGPTECAVDVTWYDCAAHETDPIPIGRPIDNCQIYILDSHLQPLPVGITGQICIGGVPVGQGYINAPERTEQVFVKNPFRDGLLYLTGDFGYLREDGMIVYCGRRDQQVKINGQRIELGEIEAALNRFVVSAAVIVENNRLIAFYTGEKQDNLREKLARILPRHMVPHTFFHLEEMPLTANGKLNRMALLSIPHPNHTAPVAPATSEEQVLLAAVQEVLSLNDISTTDNFYEIGGDSLSSIHVVTLLQEQGYDLSVSDFLKSETLAEAALTMRQASPLVSYCISGPAPLPPIINAYLYEKPDSPASFAQTCVIPLNASAQEVQRALDTVIAHHDALRAVFSEEGCFSIGNSTYTFREEQGAIIDESVSFDLRHGPLVDAVLYPDTLKLTIHHYVVDAFSWAIIIRDLKAVLRHESLPPKTASYLEWASTIQHSEDYSWASDFLPLLRPTDHVNSEERYCFTLDVFPNDMLLTALGLAANHLVNGKAGICVETHGRFDSRFSRTVGWFTAFYPFVTESLNETRDILRNTPDYGADYLPLHGHLPENASIIYNFISLDVGGSVGSLPLFPGKINVNCLKKENELLVEIGVPAGHHAQGITEKLGVALQHYLTDLYSNPNESTANFTDTSLSATEIEEIQKSCSPEDIYSLTPTQLGMFRNWDSYWLQYTVELKDINPYHLEQALSLLAKRHPILRSKFITLNNGAVKQLILPEITPSLQSADFRSGCANSLFHVDLAGDMITIRTHHIILDGWSLSILVRDLKRFFEEPDATAKPTSPFGLYSEWLKTQPSSISYWKRLLSGCGISSDLPHHGNVTEHRRENLERILSVIDLTPYAKKHRVSTNTVLESAFSLLLLQYNPSAIYGKMLSGRNAPIQGIHDMVGPFVNMVPVYVKSGDDILSQVHEQSIMANQYSFTPLSELYAHTDLKRIHVLFVNENYPMENGVKLLGYDESNEFDLTFTIRETDCKYVLRASFAPEKYDASVIAEALTEFEKCLSQLIDKDVVLSSPKQLKSAYSAPIGETERTICKLFETVIGTSHVGRTDNFFDLGGTSLDMMEILCSEPLDKLTPSDIMTHPTPADLAALLACRSVTSIVIPLYTPKQNCESAIVLFSYGGGDAAAYTALVGEFRKRNAATALYFCPWTNDYDTVVEEIRALAVRYQLSFYSHCAGAVTAMKLLDRLNVEHTVIQAYFVGANIPPTDPRNFWPSVPDEILLDVLHKAGMPELPHSQTEDMIRHFRANTAEYFQYFQDKKHRTPATVTLVLSRNDIFTQEYLQAVDLWKKHVTNIKELKYFDFSTHYFQSSHADILADILLEKEP